MKTAIYIEDGVVQLVLTPESSFEKNAVTTFANKPFDCVFKEGSFYDCAGGWIRHNQQDRSLIFIARTLVDGTKTKQVDANPVES